VESELQVRAETVTIQLNLAVYVTLFSSQSSLANEGFEKSNATLSSSK